MVINNKFKLEKSIQEILYKIDAWINNGSSWIFESFESQYINISNYSPLLGSSYVKLPTELDHPRKELINIRNKDQKCFLWYHVRNINPKKDHAGKISKNDKRLASNLSYDGIEFPVKEKDFKKMEVQNNISIYVFSYEDKLVFPIYISSKNFEDSMNLLLLLEDNKSHYVYIKDFNTFMFHKTKNKNKKWFGKSCLKCFSSEKIRIKHREDCLSINGVQSVKVEEGIIKSEDNFKQLPAPFKIYADFECNLKNIEIYEGTCTKKYHHHIPCSLAYKIVCVDDRFSKPIVIYRGKNAA